ncbi:hypothetical protein D3C72_2063410 [compost metagenome]
MLSRFTDWNLARKCCAIPSSMAASTGVRMRIKLSVRCRVSGVAGVAAASARWCRNTRNCRTSSQLRARQATIASACHKMAG